MDIKIKKNWFDDHDKNNNEKVERELKEFRDEFKFEVKDDLNTIKKNVNTNTLNINNIPELTKSYKTNNNIIDNSMTKNKKFNFSNGKSNINLGYVFPILAIALIYFA